MDFAVWADDRFAILIILPAQTGEKQGDLPCHELLTGNP